ncbi:MAG: hypothetical protein OXH57_08700, partial [Ekhidna sp.]|nr:hypothetical protein [Ekhidna sp.]
VNNVSDNFSETDIDFNNYLVLTVFLQVIKTGSTVEVKSVNEEKSRIHISYTFDISTATIPVIGQPFHIVKIPKTNKTIEFECIAPEALKNSKWF